MKTRGAFVIGAAMVAGAAAPMFTACGHAPEVGEGAAASTRENLVVDGTCALSAGADAGVWCANSMIGKPFPPLAASVSYDNGVFSVSSNDYGVSEDNVYHPEDAVTYVYNPTTATSAEIVAHIQSDTSTPTVPIELGVMLRENLGTGTTLDADAQTARMGEFSFLGNQSNPEFGCDGYGSMNSFWATSRQVSHGSIAFGGTAFAMPTRSAPPDLWLRLQRVGNDYTIAHSRDFERTWVPFWGGGFGTSTSPIVNSFLGFYAAVRGDHTQATSTANVDVTYLGPPRLSHKTTWLGGTAVPVSAGARFAGLHSLYVAPDGSGVYSTTVTQESGITLNKLDSSLRQKLAVGVGFGISRGGLTGDSSGIYLALADQWSTTIAQEWVEHRDANLGLVGSYPASGSRGLTSTWGQIGGMSEATVTIGGTATKVTFLTDIDHQTIHALTWNAAGSAATDHATTSALGFVPGPLTYVNGRLWILLPATAQPSPLYPYSGRSSDFLPTSVTPKLVCKVPTVPASGPVTLTDCGSTTLNGATPALTNPVAITSYGSGSATKLVITDNGIGQNVKLCTIGTGTTPTGWADVTLYKGAVQGSGAANGVVGGSTPPLREFSPLAAGYSTAGSSTFVYVADHAPGIDISKVQVNATSGLPTSGAAVSKFYGLPPEYGAFDPSSGGSFYTPTRRMSFNLANTAPGSEWKLESVTLDPFNTLYASPINRTAELKIYAPGSAWNAPGNTLKYQNGTPADLRLGYGGVAHSAPRLRRLPNGLPTDQLFMFLPYFVNGSGRRLAIFRFVGEEAIPYGAVEEQATASGGLEILLWLDTTGTGQRLQNDEHTLGSLTNINGTVGWDVDTKGNIWRPGPDPANPTHYGFQRFNMTWSGGLPTYSLSAMESYWLPAPYDTQYVPMFRFDYQTDPNDPTVMGTMFAYAYGTAGTGGCSNANPPTSPGNPRLVAFRYHTGVSTPDAPLWDVGLPWPSTDAPDDFSWHVTDSACQCLPDYNHTEYNSFDSAGAYVFIKDPKGPVHVHRKTDGREVTRLFAGPEVSGGEEIDDLGGSMSAVLRPNNEYVVTSNDFRWPRTLAYRWTPPTITTPFDFQPMAWYVASAADIDQTNHLVTRWRDRSGNGRDVVQSNPSAQPTFAPTGWNSAKPTIAFDGGRLLQKATWTDPPAGDDKPFTVLATLKVNAISSPQMGIAAWWTDNWPNIEFCRLSQSGSQVKPDLLRIGTYNVNEEVTAPQDLGTTSGHVVAWRFNNAPAAGPQDALDTFVDGVKGTTVLHDSNDPVLVTTFMVGSTSPLPTDMFNGNISELVVVGRSLSDAEVRSYGAYAVTQWPGLPAQQP